MSCYRHLAFATPIITPGDLMTDLLHVQLLLYEMMFMMIWAHMWVMRMPMPFEMFTDYDDPILFSSTAALGT